MKLDPVMNEIEAAIDAQLRLAGAEAAEAADDFLFAFRPAVQQGLVRAVEQAAAEVSAQLGDQQVDVRLVDGDPELAVRDVGGESTRPDDEMEARITLRLPEHLKTVIEDAASSAGESINGWVVETLRTRTSRTSSGTRVKETFDL